MTQTLTGTTDDQISVDEWLAIRKQAGLEIDPDSADVMWTYGYVIDPYGAYADARRIVESVAGGFWCIERHRRIGASAQQADQNQPHYRVQPTKVNYLHVPCG